MEIRSRLLLIVGIVSLIATLAIGAASYLFSKNTALAEARSKGQLILDYVFSSREYFMKNQRPLILELVEKERFYPDLMSGFVVSRGIWEQFRGRLAGFEFKQASLDPLYSSNLADAFEVEVIDRFRKATERQSDEGVVDKNGEEFFYLAKPIKLESKGCLQCHGDPLDAPKDQIEVYGTEHGYNWKLGDTVSSYIVYVSVQQGLHNAKRTAGLIFLVSMAGFLVAMMGIWLLLDQSLPIMESRHDADSQGEKG